MYYQQGDVIIEKTNNLPDKIKKCKREQGRLILAEGEVTGHAHVICDDKCDLMCDEQGNLFLSVNVEETTVTHEEHKSINIEQGDYIIRGVREYDHFAEEARRVVD